MAAKSAPGAVFVVTHVDVPPPKKYDCIAALKALVADSRKESGVTRFEVFQQTSRANHFSVVEIGEIRTHMMRISRRRIPGDSASNSRP